ncbi:hypothetical protein F53441_8307 [Fusarium austroafricanum]|uniref:Uncharacterized protein n=1 Tax=Fusarium austroafricanum TaxID=2364996 RepID=A0A8H4KFD5_9HYPO|nr:hypothetical protein F53441_8307 [Fusarium austroafricanum]
MSRQAHLQNTMNKLNIDDSQALVNAFDGDAVVAHCHRARTNPLNYLSKTFKYSLTLLAVMFDTGCVISGSRALDFFVPGSATEDSDWDFYVPGYKESVADVMSILTLCGVTWESNVDSIATKFLRHGRVEINSNVLDILSSWYSPGMEAGILGETVHEIVAAFTRMRSSIPDAKKYIISRGLCGDLIIAPDVDEGCHVEESTGYETASGEQFSMIRGSIETSQGTQSVQLIIGCHYRGIRSCLSFIKEFYASHVQCFIGGWCAAHMYYYHASSRDAVVWGGKQSTKAIDRAIEKYCDRGFSFHDAPYTKPTIRRFDDVESMFLDYGEVYRAFLRKSNFEMFDKWMADRRQNIEGIHWVEFGSLIERICSPFERCSRGRPSFAEARYKLPIWHLRRLADIITLNTAASDMLRTKEFFSNVRKTIAGMDWNVTEVVRSGNVYNSLQDASPWSWAM